MNLDELKKLREENFLAHKKKKREYYLKNKAKKETQRKVIDYEKELNEQNFAKSIKKIVKAQKEHIDDRKELIVAKLNEYKDKKKEYYKENKKKRLEYDKEYREKKKEELKEYRRNYYLKNKEKILAKQKEKRENLKKRK